MEREGRFIYSYKDGGVTSGEALITFGIAAMAEKGLDALTGNDNHGWYCIAEDIESGLKDSRWGATKQTAKAKAKDAIYALVKEWEYEKEQENKANKVAAEMEAARLYQEKSNALQRGFKRQDSESMEWFIIRIVFVYLVVPFGILYLIGFVIAFIVVPILFCTLAIIPLVYSILRINRKKLLLWLSVASSIYLFVDYQIGWISKGIMEHQTFLKNVIPFFVFLNQIAGLISIYILFHKPAEIGLKNAETIGQKFTQRNVMILVALLIIGTTLSWLVHKKYSEPALEVAQYHFATSSYSDAETNKIISENPDHTSTIVAISKTAIQDSKIKSDSLAVSKKDKTIEPTNTKNRENKISDEKISISTIAQDLVGKTFGLKTINSISQIKSLKSKALAVSPDKTLRTYQITFVIGDDEFISRAEVSYQIQGNRWVLIRVQDRYTDRLIEKKN